MKSFSISKRSSKNRGVIMALCFLISFSFNSFGKIANDTIILTNENSIDPTFRSCISDNFYSYSTSHSWDINKREIVISKLNLKNHVISKLSIKVPTNIKILQCPTYCLTDSFLLLQDEYDLQWFLFKNMFGKYKFIDKIILPKNTMALNAKVLNEHMFLLTDIYNHHPLDSVSNVSLCTYDALLRKVTHEIHPVLPCIGLSHFPQNWISQNDKFIAVAEPCGNKIQIYNINLKLTRTISLPLSSSWTNLPGNKIPIETSPALINPKEFIGNFKNTISKFSRIETLQFANDSLLLISCNHPDSAQVTHENFVYNAKQDLFMDPKFITIKSSEVSDTNKTSGLTFHITPHQLLRNGICIMLLEDNFIPNPKLTTQENENNKNTFYEKNDPEFIIRLSKIEIE